MVVLAGLHHRVHGVAATVPARHHHGQLALEVDELLHQHAAAALGEPRVGRAGLLRIGAQRVAVAVVAQVARLQHERPAQVAADGLEIINGVGYREWRHGQSLVGQPLLLQGLVLHHPHAGRVGAHGRAGVLNGHEELGIDELVLEREHADLAPDAKQGVSVLPVTLHHAGGHGRGGLAGLPEHRHPDAERPGRQHGHLCQLAGSGDADVVCGGVLAHAPDGTSAPW